MFQVQEGETAIARHVRRAREGGRAPRPFELNTRRRMIPAEREAVQQAVRVALYYWPNDGRDSTVREDIRSAFLFIRARLRSGMSLSSAAGQLESDAYRYADM